MTKRILVIDDEDGVREIIQISLESTTNWEILTASSGREGIEIAQSQHPDVILLDVMMPYMDGPTTFKQLRAITATCDIPAILLTAKAQSCEQQEFLDLGIEGIITKPFLPEDLVMDICKILNWNYMNYMIKN
ncbi:response regulator with CheY-like receiver domain and winged-helix DNA-binding domain [Nostoc sp. PCC 7524]|uniref:response regulator n=1 Tax=Nostoc sp. (strain ATCC 29411 / PCC 7524) TaxID=28072 RepID=UPI00029F3F01|nr:response regulator [Nostoc sp. PCC 7524]AFY48468.1 response regulator with CheY-like receiver domain and winged-helix DNA-binding domain [Nostoc sp. PCC 7524]